MKFLLFDFIFLLFFLKLLITSSSAVQQYFELLLLPFKRSFLLIYLFTYHRWYYFVTHLYIPYQSIPLEPIPWFKQVYTNYRLSTTDC